MYNKICHNLTRANQISTSALRNESEAVLALHYIDKRVGSLGIVTHISLAKYLPKVLVEPIPVSNNAFM